MSQFNGLGLHLGNISRLSTAKTRSISPENFTGEKGKGGMATSGTGEGCARELGQGWKISPSKTNANSICSCFCPEAELKNGITPSISLCLHKISYIHWLRSLIRPD